MANNYVMVKVEWSDLGYNQGYSFFAAVPAKASSQEISAWALKKLIRNEYDREYIVIDGIFFVCNMEIASMFIPDAFRYIESGKTKTFLHTFDGNIANLCRKNSCYNYDRPPAKFLVMGDGDFEYLRSRLRRYSKQYELDV